MKKWLWQQFGFTNHLVLIACFVAYEKWVESKMCLFEAHLPYI